MHSCRVKKGHPCGNDWILLGGEKRIEVLHPCGERELQWSRLLLKWTLGEGE